MDVWQAIVLGVLQGLTEFLPVSSSGHIEIAREVLGIEAGDNMQLTMMLHLGTVLSTVCVFWGEIGRLLRDVFRFRMNDGTVFVLNLLISALPVALIGFMFHDSIEGLFSGNLLLVGAMLIVTAVLLVLSGRFGGRQGRPVTPQRAFVVGIAQAVAVLPGLSRSGATISAGLLQGVGRETVAKFSFLMALIPIVGECALQIAGGTGAGSVLTAPVMAGFLAAFVTGWLACRWMIKLVTQGRLVWFAAYCVALGLFAIGYSVLG